VAISALEVPAPNAAATFCCRSLRAAGRWAAANAARDEAGRLSQGRGLRERRGLGVQGMVVDGERSHAVLVGRSRLLEEWSRKLLGVWSVLSVRPK